MLDALCLGRVGKFADFGALCDDADAVAAVAKTPAAWRLVLLIDGALASVLASGAALGAVLADDAALMALMECGPSLEAFLADDDAVASLLADGGAVAAAAETAGFSSALASDAGLRASALASDASLAAISASPVSMGALAASETCMGELAADARALNAVAKSPVAREAWMRSGFAHTFYAKLYETLHNAPDTLFAKHETEYDRTSYSNPNNVVGPLYTTEDGGLSSPPRDGGESHELSVPNETIVLLKRAGSDNQNYKSYYGSSQTKENALELNYYSGVLPEVNKVFVGGMSNYCNKGTYSGSAFSAAWAVYTAI